MTRLDLVLGIQAARVSPGANIQILADTRKGCGALEDCAGVATWGNVPAVQARQHDGWPAEAVGAPARFAPERRRPAGSIRNVWSNMA
ncbi:MAG: hypothetical protein R2853_04540 [Thermomicrobiales bacterium]